MTNARCPACGRPQGNGILCNACCCVLEYELGDPEQGVAALLAELDVTLARQGKGETAGKGGLAHERIGFHQGASIATGALTNTLTTWARDVVGEEATFPDDAKHPAAIAAWLLLSDIPACRSHPSAAELHDEIVSAIRQARHAIDRAANRTIIKVGPCPEENEDGQPCPGEVLAYIPTEDDRPSRMECTANGSHRYTSVQWLRTGRRILATIDKRKRSVA